jgi:acyl carrier protein
MSEPVNAPTSFEEVESVVRSTIVQTLMLDGIEPGELDGQRSSFIMALGANSIDALEIIIAIEDRFRIEFDDREMHPELLDTLNGFVAAVGRKLGIPPPGAVA